MKRFGRSRGLSSLSIALIDLCPSRVSWREQLGVLSSFFLFFWGGASTSNSQQHPKALMQCDLKHGKRQLTVDPLQPTAKDVPTSGSNHVQLQEDGT